MSRENLYVLEHGTLHLGTLHFAILEGHVWASIEGERVGGKEETCRRRELMVQEERELGGGRRKEGTLS